MAPRIPIGFLVLLAACESGTERKVREISRDVQTVQQEQRVMRTEIDATKEQSKMLSTSVAAMGTGFNVLSESVVEQDTRVDKVETGQSQLRRQVQKVAQAQKQSGGTRTPPDTVGLYTGIRFDTKTLMETPVRMQWCEGDEGRTGFLVFGRDEPDYHTIRCWRFGATAQFRSETAQGPQTRCLRDVTLEDSGELRAIDCDDGSAFYRMTLR